MIAPVILELPLESRALLARMERFPTAMQQGITRALDYENEITVGEIQRTRLSARGPETLGVVTNRLRSSIRPSKAMPERDGRTISSAIGSNVAYAGAHERGFKGAVQVRQHERKIEQFKGGHREVAYLTRRGAIAKRKGTVIARGVTTVKAHTRRVNIKERAYIRRTLESRRPAYGAALTAATLAALRGTTLEGTS